ncbi:MAG: hypothetical protein RLY16_1088 [Bacteroidota bacterium]|jgi:dienelactone hydrolase
MKQILSICMAVFFLSLATNLKAQTTSIVGEEVTYSDASGTALKGYVAYDGKIKGARPAVLVIHEWWGINDYARKRADMLAALGYIAIAVDMYGDAKQGNTPQEAGALATPFYKDPKLAYSRVEAALNKIKTYPQTDAKNIAAIGYCFGGSMVLNAAKLGMNLKGVVSFHGGLAGVPATTGTTKAKILVCHGAADKFISDAELTGFKANLDSVKVNYTFKSYPDATHAFSNPEATEKGKKFNIPIAYNAEADKNSWNDMKAFLENIFK